MVAIETLVIATASSTPRGWTFEGKTADEWLAWAMGMKDIPGRRADADEGFLISNRLQELDNYDQENRDDPTELV